VHFVGLNAKRVRWMVDERPAEELLRENYARIVPILQQRIRTD
jgi:hypothetical protein